MPWVRVVWHQVSWGFLDERCTDDFLLSKAERDTGDDRNTVAGLTPYTVK